ncbi:MAG: peptide deformylase [Endozoicomonadaceae bacterium]|nr:peptide deformylase [Endozoicomonadaceae bacterium]MBE8233377.1 peptide deformylase [Endozoicomonadaceae bacterium]
MALLTIYEHPHVCLSKIAQPIEKITEDIQQLSQDLLETMYHHQGCGLAATQVNIQKRIFVMDISDDQSAPKIFINPKIEIISAVLKPTREGCLSVPNVFERVKRPEKIQIEFWSLEEQLMSLELTGLESACAQHETDHLNGQLFLFYLDVIQQERAMKKIKKYKRRSS